MTSARLLITVTAALLVFLVFFEVEPRFEFALATDVSRPDPERERAYTACFEARDAEIHATAFGTIDNPDVQREFISMQREEAERACRDRFPVRMVSVREPLRFNLVDVRPRFGN